MTISEHGRKWIRAQVKKELINEPSRSKIFHKIKDRADKQGKDISMKDVIEELDNEIKTNSNYTLDRNGDTIR